MSTGSASSVQDSNVKEPGHAPQNVTPKFQEPVRCNIISFFEKGMRTFPKIDPLPVGRITILELDGNRLKELPEYLIGDLPYLETLTVGRNKLKRLPNNIGDWTRLREISVPFNRITFLPVSMSKLSRLEYFNMEANPLNPTIRSVFNVDGKWDVNRCKKFARAVYLVTVQVPPALKHSWPEGDHSATESETEGPPVQYPPKTAKKKSTKGTCSASEKSGFKSQGAKSQKSKTSPPRFVNKGKSSKKSTSSEPDSESHDENINPGEPDELLEEVVESWEEPCPREAEELLEEAVEPRHGEPCPREASPAEAKELLEAVEPPREVSAAEAKELLEEVVEPPREEEPCPRAALSLSTERNNGNAEAEVMDNGNTQGPTNVSDADSTDFCGGARLSELCLNIIQELDQNENTVSVGTLDTAGPSTWEKMMVILDVSLIGMKYLVYTLCFFGCVLTLSGILIDRGMIDDFLAKPIVAQYLPSYVETVFLAGHDLAADQIRNRFGIAFPIYRSAPIGFMTGILKYVSEVLNNFANIFR